jgi:flagellar hook-associated protein 1 FlgK
MPIQTVPRQSGGIDIVTQEGVYLLQTTARRNRVYAFDRIWSLRRHWPAAASQALSVGRHLHHARHVILWRRFERHVRRAVHAPRYRPARLQRPAGHPRGRPHCAPVRRLPSIRPRTPGEQGLFVDSDGSGDPGLAGRLALNPAIDPSPGRQHVAFAGWHRGCQRGPFRRVRPSCGTCWTQSPPSAQ